MEMKASPEERIFRYELLEDARMLYRDFHLEDRLKTLSSCSRFAPMGQMMFMVRPDGSVGLSGMNRCKSRSSCPVCALPSQVRSYNELWKGISNARKMGFCPYLVTYTFSHGMADELCVIQSAFQMAREIMYRNGSFRMFARESGLKGRITNYEVQMCGENGYHPHSHELEFFDHDIDVEYVCSTYSDQYLKALSQTGLTARDDIGVDIQGYSGVGDYLTKFSSELTLHLFTKESYGGGSLSPMKCLSMYHATRDRWYAIWFLDYVLNVKRKRMIGWSRGLRELLNVKDDKMADVDGDEVPLLVINNKDDFRRLSSSDWRRVTEELNRGNVDEVTDYLKRVSISYYISFNGLEKLQNGVM